MKKFLKIIGVLLIGITVILYLSFLFILPKKVDLNAYKHEIQKIVRENTGFNIDFDNVDVITTPLLEAGLKTKDIKVTLPDGSVLLSADTFKTKVFLPSLLLLSVRVSEVEINSPEINLEIVNSEKYKAAKVYEDLVNKKREQKRLGLIEQKEPTQPPFDISKIKIFVPSVKLNNYKVKIDDTKVSHKLTINGNQIKAGYFNKKIAKLKADLNLFSDENKNISANIDLDSFIPNIKFKQRVQDDEAVFELPFFNPVEAYRAYDLKSDINSKIKVRRGKNDDKLWAKGNINIENTSITLSGLELPPSYFKLIAKGNTFDIDTNIFATKDEYLNMTGTVSTGANPYLDLTFKSTKVHLQNLLNIAKAYLDTINIKHNFTNMTAGGYIYSNFKIKTDFKSLESNGKFIIRDGNIYDKTIGLILNNIKANVILDDDMLVLKDTSAQINNRPLQISGTIGENSYADINIFAQKIPLPALYKAFAPRQIKENYNLNSGFVSIDSKIKGEIKNTLALIKAELQDFNLNDKNNSYSLDNKLSKFVFVMGSDNLRGKLSNTGFKFTINNSGSTIINEYLQVDFDNKDATIPISDIRFNKNSIIALSGGIKNYLSNPDVHITARGFINDNDIKTFIGEAIAPYLESSGAIPVNADFISKKDRMRIAVQAQAQANSYITPVEIEELVGKNVLLQLYAEKRDNNIVVHRSGIFVRPANAQLSDNFMHNLVAAKEIVNLKAILTNLHRKPFLSLFRIIIHNELTGKICAFENSKFLLSGSVNAFGALQDPNINGKFEISRLEIPQWLVRIRNIAMNIHNREIRVHVRDVNANDSDFNIDLRTDFQNLAKTTINNLSIRSGNIDIEKILKVSEGIISSLPKPETKTASSSPSDIPIQIRNGSMHLRRIASGKIILRDTTGHLALLNNILHINRLRTNLFDGNAQGNIDVNLLNMGITAKLQGKDFNVEKMLVDTINMKDAVSGNMNFSTDISFNGTSVEQQMKSLKGEIDFNIKTGQLGPFGKFENFLMAENIRENAFFSSAIGSIITNIVTFDTSRYNSLYGHLTFNDGFAKIAPIKSQGNVMSLYIAGDIGLLDNSADMILRGKLGSAFSDKLGPLANINPVNLVKNTPGLNIVLAKSFTLFCQAVSEEEMSAIPQLEEGKSDDYATKFQIKLLGDTRKPLKMVKSFKWLALNSEIESAQNFVDTMPVPEPGEENLSVDEIIELRKQQELEQKAIEEANKSIFKRIKNKFTKNPK